MRVADLERFDRGSVGWFFRVYGLALVANVATEARAGVWRVHEGSLYPWRHLPILPLWPTWVLAIEWSLTAAAGLALATGFARRPAVFVAAGVTLASVLERYSNHGVLLFLVAFYLALGPPDVRREDFERTTHPNLGLVRAQLVIVYLFGALNKISHGFVRGTSLVNLLGLPVREAQLLSVLVVVVELALPVLLVVRPKIGIAGVVLLHTAFAAQMPGLWSFGLVMVAMALLFVPPPAAELTRPSAPT